MKYNEIKRLQQLAGIITEIKVNNPNMMKINAVVLNDDGESKFINYSDIGVGASIYENEDNAITLFDINDDDWEIDYDKLINLLKRNNIRDYRMDGDRHVKFIIIPLKHINITR